MSIQIDNVKMWESLIQHGPNWIGKLIEISLKDQQLMLNAKGEIVPFEFTTTKPEVYRKETDSLPALNSGTPVPSPIFKKGDIIVSGKSLIFEIAEVCKDCYLIQDRPGVTIPFGLQDNWELLSVAEKRIREKMVSEINIPELVESYMAEYPHNKVYQTITYKQGIDDVIKKIKGEQ